MVLKKAFNLYINSSLHVALAVVAFATITCLNFQISLDPYLMLFIFFGTITGYNFIKYAGSYFTRTRELRNIGILSILALIGLVIILVFLNLKVIITSAFLGMLTVFYAIPLSSRIGNLRDVPRLKIYIIAFVVAGVTVVLPLINAGIFPGRDQIIDFLQRFIIAVVLILPFEIRDMDRDIYGLGTLPQQLGVRRSKMLGNLLILIFVLLEFLKAEIHLAYLLSLIFLGIIAALFLEKSSVNQGEYYASFWVEAAPWFWLGILYILGRII